jgi:putative membrane protein
MQDMTRTNTRDVNNVWKGFAAGLVGGLVASWTMNRFQDVWSTVAKDVETWQANQFHKVSGEQAEGVEETSGTKDLEFGSKQEVPDDTTMKAASAVSEGVFGHKLTQSEKKIGGTAVHYLFGTGVGGLYGAAAEVAPNVTAGAGLPFGAVFWLVVDEGAVPLLGLSEGPMAYPLSIHAYALSSHFVYGFTAEVVRRAVRAAL